MKKNLVLWFMHTVRDFGGEYTPIRDLSYSARKDKKRMHGGRRELRQELTDRKWARR